MGTKKVHPVRYSDWARKSKHKSRIPGVYVGDEGIRDVRRKGKIRD